MLWLWITMLALAILLPIVTLSYIYYEIQYSRAEQNDRLTVEIKALFGLVRYRLEVPVIRFTDFTEGIMLGSKIINETSSQQVREDRKRINKERIIEYYHKGKLMLEKTTDLLGWVKKTLKHVECTRLSWTTQVGVGDAPQTAITTGMVWGIKSSVLGYALKYFKRYAKPQVMVIPLYNKNQLFMDFNSITRIRLFYAVLAGIRLLIQIMKVRGGLRAWYRNIIKPGMKPVT